MTRLRDLMTPASKGRYLLWRTGLLGDAVTVRLASGERIVLQRSMHMGLNVAYEIFISGTYRSPRPLDPGAIRRIVDVGANAGFSVAFWGVNYPRARIDAFEPHPAHLAPLRRTVALNRLDARATVYPAAVGVAPGSCELISAGVCSTAIGANERVGAARELATVKAPVVDFFAAMNGDRIDLLKIDCEGAEYDLLMDPRFAALDAGALVMEWHATRAHPEADREVIERLRQLRWEVIAQPGETREAIGGLGILRVGMVWAYR